MITLVLGGNRSGKSEVAERLAAATGEPISYVATADANADGFGPRIDAHRARRPATWAETRRDRPDLFHRACDLETLLNTRRAALGKDPVWLTRFNRPLAEAIGTAQDTLPGLHPLDAAGCDNGTCFT